MKRISPPQLARLAALVLMLCGLFALGAGGAAWATPLQAPEGQTVPTRGPGSRLNLGQVSCAGADVLVEFVLVQLPDNITDFGAVSYVVNGQTRTAAFERRTGNVAHYIDRIPPSAQAPNGSYDVTSATVTLVAGGQPVVLSLQNPNRFTAVCRTAPPPTPRRGGCPVAPQRNAAGPNTEAEVADCPWWASIELNDLSVNGTFEMRLLAAGATPPPNTGNTFFGPQVELNFFDANGNLVSNPAFARPVKLCYNYTNDSAARGNLANLVIQTYDTTLRRWVALPTTLEADTENICTQLPHLSIFSVVLQRLGGGVRPVALPNTGAASDILIPFWVWLMIGAAGGVAGSRLAHKVARKR